MKAISNKRTRELLTRLCLFAGVVYFGFIFPDSFSDHEKIVHFGAHVGMSFLIGVCVYFVCHFRLGAAKRYAYLLSMGTILVVGICYKYFEIAAQGIWHLYSLGEVLILTHCYSSMSENLAGALAAILLLKAQDQAFSRTRPTVVRIGEIQSQK